MRFSVDGRARRIEMLAFSNENELVWTGLRFVCIRIIIKMIKMMMITITTIKFLQNFRQKIALGLDLKITYWIC